ncbi:MAG: helix-turn-helix domain-containing protein, partial [Burkholderiales bacterium]
PILTRFFLTKSAKQLGVEAKRLSDNAMQFLSALDLPGNVRQLENLCNWITVMALGQTVEVKDLPQELTDGYSQAPVTGTQPANPAVASPYAVLPPGAGQAPVDATPGIVDKPSWIALLETEAAHMLAAGLPEVMDALGRQFESTLIKAALRHTHGRKNDAAVRLGIGRNTITRKIQELGIDGAKDD